MHHNGHHDIYSYVETSGRGSRSIFLPDSKISGGMIGHIRPKKKVYQTQISRRHKNPQHQPPLPLLSKIGHQLHHGQGSISSDMVLTKKHPCQRITYLLGSMLMRAFLFMCCFCCKTAFFTLKNRINDDDNYNISAGNLFIRIVGDPPLPPKGACPPPKTPHITRLPSIVGGRGALLVETMGVTHSPIVGAAGKQC